MPLVDLNASSAWFPVDASSDADDTPEMRTIVLLSELLESGVSAAVSEVDGEDNAPPPCGVRVNLCRIHRRARNAAQIEIIVQPGNGDHFLPFAKLGPLDQRGRRMALRDQLESFIHSAQRATENALGPNRPWPTLTVEVSIAGGLSGFEMNADGKVIQSWD